MIRVRPAPPLDAVIEALWWNRGDAPALAGEHQLPSARAQLVVALHDTPFTWTHSDGAGGAWSRGVLHGSQNAYYRTDRKAAGVAVGASLREAGLSRKTIIARFRDDTGLTPVRYFRVRRFHRTVQAMLERNGASITAVAANCGFTDHSHLVRDFRELAGIVPSAYRVADAQSPLHHSLA